MLLESLAEADAVALGASDWSAAPSSTALRDAVAALEVPVLAANLVCAGTAPFPPSRVVEREGRRIGLVGVTEGDVEGCTVQPPGPALLAAVAALEGVDAVVALVPLASEASVSQVVGSAGVDVVVDGSGRYGASGPKAMGAGWAIGAGTRGKHLGRAELVFVPGGAGFQPVLDPAQAQLQVERLEKRLASVEQRIEQGEPDAPRTKALQTQRQRVQDELVEARKAAAPLAGTTQHQLRLSEVALSRDVADHAGTLARVEAVSVRIAGGVVQSAGPRVVDDATSPWAGADACTSCHEGPATQWASTPHARGYATLAASGDAADASCVPCHVTGWAGTQNDFRPHPFPMATTGPTTPADVGGLRDVQCESCHGPSRAHVAAPDDASARPLRTPPEAVCQQCHDNQRDDHGFDLQTYLPKVVHGVP